MNRSAADPTPHGWRQRGFSRAGAIAAVLAGSRRPGRWGPGIRLSARVGLLVTGSIVIAVAVAVMLWTGLGPGPLDVFIGAVRVRTGLPLGMAIWLVIGASIALAWALGRRPGPGTIAGPLLIGPVMQATVSMLDSVGVPDPVIVRVAIHLAAVVAVGFGAGALIVSGLGAGSGELLAIAASDRTGRTEPRVRFACELTWLAIGVALGGPIGLGTIMVALAIGPAVANGYRMVNRIATRAAASLVVAGADHGVAPDPALV